MKLKVIILDFDGVVVESVGIKDWAFEEMFKGFSKHFEEIMAYHKAQKSTIRFEQFRHITEKILAQPYTDSVEKKLSEQFSALVFNRIVACPFVNGAQEFLKYFSQKMPLYLASINPSQELDNILVARNLKNFFKKIYPYPWKKTDAIKDILKQEGIAKAEAVFIGDTLADYQAARGSGIAFIARPTQDSFAGINVPVYKDMKEIQAHLENLVCS